PDLRVQLPEAADLPVLLGHQLLVQRGDLDVQVVRGEVEVRGESLDGVAVRVQLQVERARLVLPVDLIEVQQPRELALARVSEGHGVAGERLGDPGGAPGAQAPPALATGGFPACRRFPTEPSRSVQILSRAMANTA